MAEEIFAGREYTPDSARVLGLASRSGRSAYDCEFVAVGKGVGDAEVHRLARPIGAVLGLRGPDLRILPTLHPLELIGRDLNDEPVAPDHERRTKLTMAAHHLGMRSGDRLVNQTAVPDDGADVLFVRLCHGQVRPRGGVG